MQKEFFAYLSIMFWWRTDIVSWKRTACAWTLKWCGLVSLSLLNLTYLCKVYVITASRAGSNWVFILLFDKPQPRVGPLVPNWMKQLERDVSGSASFFFLLVSGKEIMRHHLILATLMDQTLTIDGLRLSYTLTRGDFLYSVPHCSTYAFFNISHE